MTNKLYTIDIDIKTLKKQLCESHISQTELALKLDKSVSSISKLLNGKREIFATELFMIKTILGLTDKDFLDLFICKHNSNGMGE